MKYISVNMPEYRGAPAPLFDELMVNESEFEDGLRCKYAGLELEDDGLYGTVEWLAQDSDYFSADLEKEIIRAFKANGAKPGCVIEYKFGLRDDGLNQSGKITIA